MNRRAGAEHAGHRRSLLHLGLVVRDPAGLPDVDVRRRAEDAIAQLALQPVISASAMISAITPTATPSVEISEMTEMNACLRRASR